MKKGFSTHKFLLCILLGSIGILLAIYLFFIYYFSNRFYFHTTINGIDASCKTVEEVQELIAKQVTTYSLTINGRYELSETITADQISLQYSYDTAIQDLMNHQKSLAWLAHAFQEDLHNTEKCVVYEKAAITRMSDTLSFFQKENVVKPTSAYIDYVDDEGFMIINETQGAALDEDKFVEAVQDAIGTLTPTLSLEERDCYKKPKVTADNEDLVALLEKVRLYASSKITYKFGKSKEVLSEKKIKNWLAIDNKTFTVKLKKKKVRAYVDKLASKYDTVGSKRTFKTSLGHKANVYGGDYGWRMDREKETAKLIKLIKSGATKTRKPIYIRKANRYGAKDWGSTYVEINLTAQHLWFYKKGKLIIESDFVSGNIRKGNGTPQGVYYILYRERDAILGARSNADYRTPVDFWMPFNGGIGLHDATWRSRFGGVIYQTNGSHGCINLPYSVAQTIFNNIDTGTTVVCYFDSKFERSQLTKKNNQNKKNSSKKSASKKKH